MPNPSLTLEQIEAADGAGIKLEITEGLPTWEFLPSPRHAIASELIARSIRPIPGRTECACAHLSDVLIEFPDGSPKRPDISIFCAMPPELDTAVKAVPKAVIEIVSRESWRKDYELNPPFYLKHGVLDVVVFDPFKNVISLFTIAVRRDLASPQTIQLQCGCQVDA